MPKVSVIIPVYNTSEYLSRCLDSVCHQTLKELEIICINDCSTDNSLQVIQEYAKHDERIKIIDFKQHYGVSVARNEGIKTASGDYIGFVDSDDFIDLDFYEKLYLKAVETGADIVKGDLQELLTSGEINVYPTNENILQTQNKFCFNLYFTTGIYKLSNIIEHNLLFPIRLIHTEDLVWLNRVVAFANKVEIVSDVFYHYKRRIDSTDTQILSSEKALSSLIGYKHIFVSINKYAKNSKLDFSPCYEFLRSCIFGVIFRISSYEKKVLCCKLLLFLYQNCIDKKCYPALWLQTYPCLLKYFNHVDLKGLVEFMNNKSSPNQLMVDNLRFYSREKLYSKQIKNKV